MYLYRVTLSPKTLFTLRYVTSHRPITFFLTFTDNDNPFDKQTNGKRQRFAMKRLSTLKMIISFRSVHRCDKRQKNYNER